MEGKLIFKEINKIPRFSWNAIIYGNIQGSNV